ncbi:GNAT family N-acetyltransferase [Acaryochloris marina]|uniref:Acetyltransferase, putative n=1 Tax=Acaryochloris marina (strain MBIC 11017) TaxID=329726 RepID=B0C9P0_ACAM1|nr:GNAT family N-acetyltransferase [Acaryochloris marina]ABW30188.1 acetyltransferase, putative [Acaryochloris marina MBIC11017]BDM79030.1 N-acetyltransferase [Acaryochloris marina MBIC10699]
MQILETERLHLRQFGAADLDAYAAMLADPEVVAYVGAGETLSRAQAWKNMAMVLGHWAIRGYGLWAVEEKATQTLIGRVGLYYPEGWPGLEVGWMLARSHWGYGYALESAKAAVDVAFNQLQRPTLISLIHPENVRSQRVAQRLGSQKTMTLSLNGMPIWQYELLPSAMNRSQDLH